MAKSKINFFEYTLPVAHSRAIDSKIAARRAFYLIGITGELSLMRVINPEGVSRVHWVAIKNEEIIGLLPVFNGETAFPIDEDNKYEEVHIWEIFFYDESFYQVIYDKDNDNIILRTFVLFSREDIVRKACKVRGWDVTSVSPVKLLNPESKKTEGVCWKIICSNSGYDWHILFMDLREGMAFDEASLAKMDYHPLSLNEKFVAYNADYILQQNKQGRYTLLRI